MARCFKPGDKVRYFDKNGAYNLPRIGEVYTVKSIINDGFRGIAGEDGKEIREGNNMGRLNPNYTYEQKHFLLVESLVTIQVGDKVRCTDVMPRRGEHGCGWASGRVITINKIDHYPDGEDVLFPERGGGVYSTEVELVSSNTQETVQSDTGGNTMRNSIVKTYEKTEDAVTVEQAFPGGFISNEFGDTLFMKANKDAILQEANRLKYEREAQK